MLKNLVRLVRALTGRSDSTLDLIWANFGAGKSHVLYHIAHLLTQQGDSSIPVYVETPEPVRHFTDLYRRITPSLPWQRIASLVIAGETDAVSPDLQRAARVLLHGNPQERNLAMDWATAGHPHLRELRTFTGISSRIESDAQAADALSDVVQVLANNDTRLILLLDEFQRLGVLHERYRSAVLSSLRSLFSRHATHFSVVVAATTKIQRTALDLLPQELRTLLGMRPSVSLPDMTEEEAAEFVGQRFGCFRPAGYSGGPADPIGEDGVRAVIEFISRQTSARLIPRAVLQALAWILDETEDSERPVRPDRVQSLLSELAWDSADEG